MKYWGQTAERKGWKNWKNRGHLDNGSTKSAWVLKTNNCLPRVYLLTLKEKIDTRESESRFFILIINVKFTHFSWYRYLAESKFLHYFGNMSHNSAALEAFCPTRKNDKTHRTVRCWDRLILSKCYSPNLLLWLGALTQNPCF